MVKRYEPYTDESSCDMCGQMIEQQDGQYVSYSDYAELEAECARLREENKMLKDNLEEIEERARLLLKREPT